MADSHPAETLIIERELRIEAESRAKHAAWTADLISQARAVKMPWDDIAAALGLSRATVIRIHKGGR